MQNFKSSNVFILGVCIVLAMTSLGYLLGNAAIEYKQLDRSVTVKGLAEREFSADIVIWPIQFINADNDLTGLYNLIDEQTAAIEQLLRSNGINADEISIATPALTDKSAQRYANNNNAEFRYSATQTVTVYSRNIDTVRSAMGLLNELGKQGIVFTGNDYQTQTEYIFTRLNEIKPEMIEEATMKAREVAEKFASDSNSTLGKIKKASQGQFSISSRDKNNPHIKKIRVVSTVQYYLID